MISPSTSPLCKPHPFHFSTLQTPSTSLSLPSHTACLSPRQCDAHVIIHFPSTSLNPSIFPSTSLPHPPVSFTSLTPFICSLHFLPTTTTHLSLHLPTPSIHPSFPPLPYSPFPPSMHLFPPLTTSGGVTGSITHYVDPLPLSLYPLLYLPSLPFPNSQPFLLPPSTYASPSPTLNSTLYLPISYLIPYTTHYPTIPSASPFLPPPLYLHHHSLTTLPFPLPPPSYLLPNLRVPSLSPSPFLPPLTWPCNVVR
ncbi:hypothetical protein Pcinc_008133 [Petrolisthes cinctipes]|uniref:Uncharacterized protein n=1 Tax=Petrolisthes cinctipes TaxID=88211 RepID=A0AAE1G737_PETCI|nr:hypothetical protein Pcinc_008133 [Petrolisthes cinctipes]